ncbi:MAG: hypothetical protein HOG49_23085 [Candidatus Scalindua sp.]|jgi:hypothetical protein|nr:hypothetical protein [Candidatus Scalindua sp.]
MIGLAIIGFTLGLIAGFGNDKSAERMLIDAKLTFLEITIPTIAIVFVIYSFTFSIGFGLLSIVEITVGSFTGKKLLDLYKNR